jgi:hypothetical protein
MQDNNKPNSRPERQFGPFGGIVIATAIGVPIWIVIVLIAWGVL